MPGVLLLIKLKNRKTFTSDSYLMTPQATVPPRNRIIISFRAQTWRQNEIAQIEFYQELRARRCRERGQKHAVSRYRGISIAIGWPVKWESKPNACRWNPRIRGLGFNLIHLTLQRDSANCRTRYASSR